MASTAIIAMLAAASLPGAPQPAAPVSPGRCEIHVWPADAFHSLTEGAVWNNVLDSAFVTRPGRKPERQAPNPARGALDPANQLELLAALDLPTLLHLPGAVMISHASVSTRRVVGPVAGRQTQSTSPCYMEVTVMKNFFNRSGLTHNTLRTLLILDDYRDRPQPVRSFAAWGVTPLSVFPAKSPEQTGAAQSELAEAFRHNVRQFGTYAFAPPRQ